jgi:hypothetical protein
MTNRIILGSAFVFVILSGCSSGKPSNSDIEKKIVMEYTCPETAEVRNLNIIDTKDAEGISGAKGYEYTVSGEIVWPKGCNEFGMVQAGHSEKFENKHVFLIEADGKWQ